MKDIHIQLEDLLKLLDAKRATVKAVDDAKKNAESASAAHSKALHAFHDLIPQKPGCRLFSLEDGRALYVGSAGGDGWPTVRLFNADGDEEIETFTH